MSDTFSGFVDQVGELKRFCAGERIDGYHLRNRTRYAKHDLALAEGWLRTCGLEVPQGVQEVDVNSMSFLSNLKTFLREHGEIYTVRRYNYQTRQCDVEGVGCCNRRLIMRVSSPKDLDPYIPLSGFQTRRDWWSMIQRFVKPGDDMFLFKVVIKR